MKVTTAAAAFSTMVLLGAFGIAARAQSSAGVVSEPMFSEAQEKRGAAIYSRECSTCHGERLKGGEGSPALTGAEFDASWNGQTVADLFERIRQTMPAPPEQPGKLTAQETADVVAHMLSVNGFPSGATELPAEIAPLKRLRIDVPKP
jgi:mono/diheme cytochrome c family protein